MYTDPHFSVRIRKIFGNKRHFFPEFLLLNLGGGVDEIPQSGVIMPPNRHRYDEHGIFAQIRKSRRVFVGGSQNVFFEIFGILSGREFGIRPKRLCEHRFSAVLQTRSREIFEAGEAGGGEAGVR